MNAILLKALPYIAALLIGATGAWMWQANSYGKIIADSNASHQADLTNIANAGAAQARQALEKQQHAEQALADLDQKAQKEKTDGIAENEKWRAAAADTARRLRIAGSCRSGGGDVSRPASASGLGDASTIELSAAAGSTVFDIRAGIIADQAALKALQSYVMNVCR
ncbi:lysis system i-spanin subunit Rz [Pseudomonas extremaustralis]|uniref:lysis system i-spanin subunit Rz n=1 Tax=Pseudomonas extremaustralis TaxID=359110 RepID=UPI002865139D|nr:lysis system i-spanin subunit Rz [Pseudomonas extremaustralis]MDR6579954.1 prophage endopeptidase [Pseudomonas extremaustralis]